MGSPADDLEEMCYGVDVRRESDELCGHRGWDRVYKID
jgi:hypothetical protein